MAVRKWWTTRGVIVTVIGFSMALGVGGMAKGAEITHLFSVDPASGAPSGPESGWRIKWEVLGKGTHHYGDSAIWEFQSIEFMKGRKDDGSEDWIKVLNNLALVEIYVPYNDGMTAFFDISTHPFNFLEALPEYLPAGGSVAAKVEDRFVISEIADDGVLWLDNNDNFRVKRGRVMKLWASFHAANYTYILTYSFYEDGTIGVRIGGTAQNFFDWNGSVVGLDRASHVHMATWRMEFDLGNASANRVEVSERKFEFSSGRATVEVRPFNDGLEGGEVWKPGRYTTLMVTNSSTVNRHRPARNVSYGLRTVKLGSLVSEEEVTKFDYWVSRALPDDERRRISAPELKFVDLPGNVENPEPIDGKAVVIWHNSGLFHIPRGEDFGAKEYYASEGAAINYYAGFDLVPINLWHMTPFLRR